MGTYGLRFKKLERAFPDPISPAWAEIMAIRAVFRPCVKPGVAPPYTGPKLKDCPPSETRDYFQLLGYDDEDGGREPIGHQICEEIDRQRLSLDLPHVPFWAMLTLLKHRRSRATTRAEMDRLKASEFAILLDPPGSDLPPSVPPWAIALIVKHRRAVALTPAEVGRLTGAGFAALLDPSGDPS
jgi:hypothetical protein